jgi:hypothetical protein
MRSKRCALLAVLLSVSAGPALFRRNPFSVAAAAALFLMSGIALADIGVNFDDPPGNNSVPPLAPTDVAGVGEYAQANYNNVWSQASNLVLNDHTGAATTATLTTTGAFFTSVATLTPAGTDETFNLGIAHSPNPWSWTVNNIPYPSYDIIVYVPGGGLDREFGNWGGVSIGGTTFYTRPPLYNNPGYFDGDPETPFPYVGPGPSNPGAEYGTNYVQFSNLTGSSQTISISQAGIWADVGGFQIVGVPEPATGATLGAGLGIVSCGCLARRRRIAEHR